MFSITDEAEKEGPMRFAGYWPARIAYDGSSIATQFAVNAAMIGGATQVFPVLAPLVMSAGVLSLGPLAVPVAALLASAALTGLRHFVFNRQVKDDRYWSMSHTMDWSGHPVVDSIGGGFVNGLANAALSPVNLFRFALNKLTPG